jgi:hypothetical protein
MKIPELKMIPQEEIESVRWIASLPAKALNCYSGRIYKAVANMKAAEQLKCRPAVVIAMKELGKIMQEAAGDADVFRQIIHAEAKIKAIPTKNKTIGQLWCHPAVRIKNQSTRPVLLAFVEAVDDLQKRHGRFPKRSEIIKMIGLDSFGDNECARQVKAAEWGEYI